MEKFHPRGSHSYKPTRSQAEAEVALHAISISPAVRALHDAIHPAQLLLVGGCVRDSFFEARVTADVDLATDLDAREARRRCIERGLHVVETGIQHGTILVVSNDTHLEVTTFRQPTDRDTQVNARDIDTDLSGRDFTINAMAFCTTSHTLIDPLGGVHDLASGTLRAVGDPHSRFLEDPLRILRMIRFGPAMGRSVHPATLHAATAVVPHLERVSVERIRHELEQILMGSCPAAGVIALKDIGALQWTLPELVPAIDFEQNRYHIHSVFDHTMAVLDRTPHDRILRWAAVFHDIGKPHTLSTDTSGERHFYLHEIVSTDLSWKRMEALKFSHDDMKRISSIVRHHMRPLNCGPAGVRRLIRDLGENLSLWRTFKDADSSPTVQPEEVRKVAHGFDELLAAEQRKMSRPTYGKLAINGDDLKTIGIKAGPRMGQILKHLEEIIIEEPDKNSREELLEIAKSLLP